MAREKTSDWRETNGRFEGLMKKARGIKADKEKMEKVGWEEAVGSIPGWCIILAGLDDARQTLQTLEDRKANDADISAVMREAGKLKEEAGHRSERTDQIQGQCGTMCTWSTTCVRDDRTKILRKF